MFVKEVLALRLTEIFPINRIQRAFVLIVFEISLKDVFILNNLKCIKYMSRSSKQPLSLILYMTTLP